MMMAEALIRRALVTLLEDPKLCEIFDGAGREKYLDELAFRSSRTGVGIGHL